MIQAGFDHLGPSMAQFRLLVLRNPAGKIVATWDEGRWWTPSESRTFTRQLVHEYAARAGLHGSEDEIIGFAKAAAREEAAA